MWVRKGLIERGNFRYLQEKAVCLWELFLKVSQSGEWAGQSRITQTPWVWTSVPRNYTKFGGQPWLTRICGWQMLAVGILSLARTRKQQRRQFQSWSWVLRSFCKEWVTWAFPLVLWSQGRLKILILNMRNSNAILAPPESACNDTLKVFEKGIINNEETHLTKKVHKNIECTYLFE